MLVRGLRGLHHLGLNLTGLVSGLYVALFAIAACNWGLGHRRAGVWREPPCWQVWRGWATCAAPGPLPNLATSRIASAAQGYVEVMGRASVDAGQPDLHPAGWRSVHLVPLPAVFQGQRQAGVAPNRQRREQRHIRHQRPDRRVHC